MAEGFITRRGGAVSEQVAAPTITQVSLDETNITFTIKNNDTSSATIVYRISSSTADGESFTLAADTTSANITIGGLDDNTSYTIFASANVEGKIKSNLTEFPFTTPEIISFISATGGTTLEYDESGKRYKSHTFTSSGNFVVNSLASSSELNAVDYLIIAGGGGGGRGNSSTFGVGGGGAGGYRTTLGTSGGNSAAESKVTVTAQTYGITIGAAGSRATSNGGPGFNGGNSSAFGITSIGGGGGAGLSQNGKNGGSGGGSGNSASAGQGTEGQGFNGGVGASGNTGASGGGAGGPGNVGSNALGGAGLSSTIRTSVPEIRAVGGRANLGNDIGTLNSNDAGNGGTASGFNSQPQSGFAGVVIVRYRIAPSA
jgi:hypothetical protein